MPTRIFKSLAFRTRHFAFAPSIKVETLPGLVRLGSQDCGLTLQPSDDLKGATVVSVGIGEDATFDVEMASRFGATVISVDPTPRAIAHFAKLQERAGTPAQQAYARRSPQPLEAYDLQNVKTEQLVLEESALWIENTTLDFYAPPNPDFVSYSIENFQNDYATDTPAITVPAITPRELMRKYGLASIPLIKLDTEGAEIEIVPHMLADGVFPRQILLEFDEMFFPSRRSKTNAEMVHRALLTHGYRCRHYDGLANYLYLRD